MVATSPESEWNVHTTILKRKSRAATRAFLLEKIFALPPTATIDEILTAKLILDVSPGKPLDATKADSIAKKALAIPKEYRYFFPQLENSDSEQKRNADPEEANLEGARANKGKRADKGASGRGRPKKSNSIEARDPKQGSILAFALRNSTTKK
jgi:hypothetical protein